MRRIEILKSWDAEIEQEWLGLIDATAAVLERLAGKTPDPAELETFRGLNERALAVSRRRGSCGGRSPSWRGAHEAAEGANAGHPGNKRWLPRLGFDVLGGALLAHDRHPRLPPHHEQAIGAGAGRHRQVRCGADLTWSAMATVNDTFTDHFSAAVGYKVLDVDYDHKGHALDARMSGPCWE
jgi:hypothetical protein